MAFLGPRVAPAGLLILVVLAGLPFIRPAEAERVLGLSWDRTYVSGLAGPYSIHQTSDGGFVMSGPSFGAWVMKANAAGMPEWQRRFIPSGYNDASGSATPTSDGGYILAGSALAPCCFRGYSAWLLKLDHRGGVEWSRIYDAQEIVSAQQTRDGGYIALGSASEAGGLTDAWLAKLDSLGNPVWQYLYRGQGFVEPRSVEETADGGFVVAAGFPLNFVQWAWVFKTDSLGNTVWQKAFGVSRDNHAYWVTQTFDGGYAVVGDITEWSSTLHGPQSAVALVLRLDANGDILWQKSYGAAGFAYASSIEQMSDGGFVISGSFSPLSLNPPVGLWGPWLLRLDSGGNLVWQRMYSFGNSVLSEVHETMDGGLIAVGSQATHCCGNVGWAMKLDSDGNIHGCNVEFQSDATLTDTSANVIITSATAVNTSFTATPTDVTVTRFMTMPQDQCKPKDKTP